MNKIIYTHLVSSTDGKIFKAELDAEIAKYQRLGTVELQYQTTPYYRDAVNYSCLIICRKKENE